MLLLRKLREEKEEERDEFEYLDKTRELLKEEEEDRKRYEYLDYMSEGEEPDLRL